MTLVGEGLALAARVPKGAITERDFERWERYHRAFVRLMREE